jgi:hypothetical protein
MGGDIWQGCEEAVQIPVDAARLRPKLAVDVDSDTH